MEYDRSKLDWVDHPEDGWAIVRDAKVLEVHTTEVGAHTAVMNRKMKGVELQPIVIHRPSLRAVYGGPTLIEALWIEMDRLMEGLMTGQGAEDEGDKFRAQELAWVLAIVTNAYDPSVDRIRAEAMARWEAAEAEADAQENALDPDQDDMMTRPEGANQ